MAASSAEVPQSSYKPCLTEYQEFGLTKQANGLYYVGVNLCNYVTFHEFILCPYPVFIHFFAKHIYNGSPFTS